MKMNTLITILDSITETSMPFNEFVLYRANHMKDERQILIVCDRNGKMPLVNIPKSLQIIRVGWNVVNMRKVISESIKQCKKNNEHYTIHMHQNKSAVLAFISMFGTEFKNKVIFTTHNTFTGYPLHNKVQSFLCGLLSNYIVCCSKSAYNGYPNILKKWKKNHVIAIQNGVDTERIDKLLNNQTNKKKDEIVNMVYVARMVPIKNHLFLINVIEKVDPHIHITFVGATDSAILTKIKEKGLEERIHCTGLIPRKSVFELLQKSDVYISPSVLEGLPVSVLEGMYVGLPAVLSNIPQHAEICQNEHYVKLLPLVEDAWVKAINDIIKKKKDTLLAEGSEIKSFISQYFSLERMHEQYSKVYNIIYSK